jgi:hypothetical protein
MTREKLSKRTRFEVMKRDGFACKYCGATAMTDALEVDHVVAVANGGSNDPDNLVTACKTCNSGKSDVPLDQRLSSVASADRVIEHAAQVRAYLEACKELQDAKLSVVVHLTDVWFCSVGTDMPESLFKVMGHWVGVIGIEQAIKAIEIVSMKELSSENARVRYCVAIMRNMRDRMQEAAQ